MINGVFGDHEGLDPTRRRRISIHLQAARHNFCCNLIDTIDRTMAIETKPIIFGIDVKHTCAIRTKPIKVVDIDSIAVWEFAIHVA